MLKYRVSPAAAAQRRLRALAEQQRSLDRSPHGVCVTRLNIELSSDSNTSTAVQFIFVWDLDFERYPKGH